MASYPKKEGSGIYLRPTDLYDFDLKLVIPDKVDYSHLYTSGVTQDKLALYFDTNNPLSYQTGNTSITSLTLNASATTSGFTIYDAGLNLYETSRVTGLTGSCIEFHSEEPLSLYYISGRQSGTYAHYDEEDYSGKFVNLFGTYFQGFYRLDSYPLMYLPSCTERGWSVEFWLKPRIAECFNDFICEPNDLYAICDLFINGMYDCNCTYEPCITWGETGYTFESLSSLYDTFENRSLYCNEGCPELLWGNTDFTFEELGLDNVTFEGFTGTCVDNSNFFFYQGVKNEDKFYNIFSGETGLTTTSGVSLVNSGYSYSTLSGNQLSSFTSSTSVFSGLTPFRDEGVNLKYLNRITGTVDNALGFRYTDDGRIGYRKVNGFICETDYYMPIIEEKYSDFSVFRGTEDAKWTHIVYRYTHDTPNEHDCWEWECQPIRNNDKLKTGRLDIFVNGFKVFTENEFSDPVFRNLERDKDLQQGVPYTLSWGGGTLGLSQTETFGGVDTDDGQLLIEKWFNGSFEGSISQMRYYIKPLDIVEIRKNFNVDKDRYNRAESFGGRLYTVDPPFVSDFCPTDC